MRDLILLSGGLDSALCLRLSMENGRNPIALGFDYGQPHKVELTYAKALAASLGVTLLTESLPTLGKSDDIVFVGRNLLFIASAVPVAVRLGCDNIVIGVNASDYARFPDCRESFMRAASTATEVYGVTVSAPLIGMSKADVVKAYKAIGGQVDDTWTCYQPTPSGDRCGTCYSCLGLEEAL